jgi:hypothetical protein
MQESSTATHPRTPRGQRSALALVSLAAALLAVSAARADSTIFRCTAPDGSIEFRQHPCHGRDRAEQVELGPDNKGWEAPPEVERPSRTTKRSSSGRSAAKRADAERKQEERCWTKRQQLDKVRHQLRSGYKAGQGQKLRRRRDEHADYIRQFCR